MRTEDQTHELPKMYSYPAKLGSDGRIMYLISSDLCMCCILSMLYLTPQCPFCCA
jgi:hypothetical protein